MEFNRVFMGIIDLLPRGSTKNQIHLLVLLVLEGGKDYSKNGKALSVLYRSVLMQTLYILLLAGSLAFGLEALLLGLGGQLAVLYRRRKFRTLVFALAVGLGIAGLAILTSAALGLEPLYPCVLALVYMLMAGKAIGALKPKLKAPPPLPLQTQPEEELRAALRKRGFGELVRKKKKG